MSWKYPIGNGFNRGAEKEKVAAADFQAAFDNGIHLYPINEQVKERNTRKLREISLQLRTPVAILAILAAKNSCRKAASACNKLAGGLDKVVLLCVGASVMITQNLWTEQGIVNGASGRVVWHKIANNFKNL